MTINVSIVEDSDKLRGTLVRALNRAEGIHCLAIAVLLDARKTGGGRKALLPSCAAVIGGIAPRLSRTATYDRHRRNKQTRFEYHGIRPFYLMSHFTYHTTRGA